MILEGVNTLSFKQLGELPKLTGQWLRADAEDIMKHGDEFTKWLLNQTPIKNDRKYVIVSSHLAYVSPTYAPFHSMGWHLDGDNIPYLSNDHFHLMNGETKVKTAFMINDLEVKIPYEMDKTQFIDWFNFQEITANILPYEVPNNCIVSFHCRHPHKAGAAPSIPEMRFISVIIESDTQEPNPLDKARITQGMSYSLKNRTYMLPEIIV